MSTSTAAPSLLEECRRVMRHDEVARALKVVQQARNLARLEPDEPVDDAAAALLAGGDVDALTDLGQRLYERQQRFLTHQQHLEGLTVLASRLQQEAGARQRDSADAALTILRDELGRVLDEAGSLAVALDGVVTADDAVDRDVVKQWKRARVLAARNVEVRHAQAVVMSATVVETRDVQPQFVPTTMRDTPLPSTATLVNTFGTVRDFADRYPDGFVRAEEPVHGTNITQVDTRGTRDATSLPWATGNPVADVVWLARHRSVVWLPSVAELVAAKRAFDDGQVERDEVAELLARGRAVAEKARNW